MGGDLCDTEFRLSMIKLTNIEMAAQGIVFKLSCLVAPWVAFCMVGGLALMTTFIGRGLFMGVAE